MIIPKPKSSKALYDLLQAGAKEKYFIFESKYKEGEWIVARKDEARNKVLGKFALKCHAEWFRGMLMKRALDAAMAGLVHKGEDETNNNI